MPERTLLWDCDGACLVGVLHLPAVPCARGVLVVVGGPQYRVGSHRQFVLLARALAAAGWPVLRFDYRGMGDSDGPARTFESMDRDLRSAVDAFQREVPGLEQVVLWGLCDAASASLMYASSDARVAGLVLLNPWVRTARGVARAYLKHYYLRRVISREFWRELFGGKIPWGQALKSVGGLTRQVLASPDRPLTQTENAAPEQSFQEATVTVPATQPLPDRMLAALARFSGKVLVILSGIDITAGEFKDLLAASRAWRRTMKSPRITRRDLADANHTFSREQWRAQVADWTQDWLRSW